MKTGTHPSSSDSGVRHAEGREKPAKTREADFEERILAIVMLKPELEPLARSLLQEYDLPQTNSDLLNYLAVFADREFQDQSLDALRVELEAACKTLRGLSLAKRRADLEQQMRDAERVGDTAKIAELISQFQSLM